MKMSREGSVNTKLALLISTAARSHPTLQHPTYTEVVITSYFTLKGRTNLYSISRGTWNTGTIVLVNIINSVLVRFMPNLHLAFDRITFPNAIYMIWLITEGSILDASIVKGLVFVTTFTPIVSNISRISSITINKFTGEIAPPCGVPLFTALVK